MFDVLYEIKDLLTEIKTLLQDVIDKNIDMAQDLSNVAGRGIYSLDDIGKTIDAIKENREPMVNVYEGKKPVDIILAAYESDEKECKVYL